MLSDMTKCAKKEMIPDSGVLYAKECDSAAQIKAAIETDAFIPDKFGSCTPV